MSRFTSSWEAEEEYSQVNVMEHLSVLKGRAHDISKAIDKNGALCTLRGLVLTAWPKSESVVLETQIRVSAIPRRNSYGWTIRFQNKHVGHSRKHNSSTCSVFTSEQDKITGLDVMLWPDMTADIQEAAQMCVLCREHGRQNQACIDRQR